MGAENAQGKGFLLQVGLVGSKDTLQFKGAAFVNK